MADFHQTGDVAVFHDLRTRSTADLEGDLATFATSRPITLVLPSLYSELHGPALAGIVEELAQVDYLHRIVIGLDRADEDGYRHALDFFADLPQEHVVIWNDGPRLGEWIRRLDDLGLTPGWPGKGRNVWLALGYVLACGDSEVVAIHDCDILTYRKDLLARLVYPVVDPTFPYQLAKGFYPRIGDGRLGGRVTRNLVGPLLLALTKVLGDRDYVDFLRSFRYPLSGELAVRTSFLADLRIPWDWGLEIGVLSEAWRNLGPRAVCQVEVADAYDHKHQDLSVDDATEGLNRMSRDVTKAIFRTLAADGTVLSTEVFRSLEATYARTALEMLEHHAHDARMNGLAFDRTAEEAAIGLFAENIVEAGRVVLDTPHASPSIPSWSLVQASDPAFLGDLQKAVAEDLAEHAR